MHRFRERWVSRYPYQAKIQGHVHRVVSAVHGFHGIEAGMMALSTP